MSYTIDRVIKDVDFEDVDRRARQALTDHGFGVLTEIDVNATMKKQLYKHMVAYRLLGACHLRTACEATRPPPRVAAMPHVVVLLRAVSEATAASAA